MVTCPALGLILTCTFLCVYLKVSLPPEFQGMEVIGSLGGSDLVGVRGRCQVINNPKKYKIGNVGRVFLRAEPMNQKLTGEWVRAEEWEVKVDDLSYDLAMKGREKEVLERSTGRGKLVQGRGNLTLFKCC